MEEMSLSRAPQEAAIDFTLSSVFGFYGSAFTVSPKAIGFYGSESFSPQRLGVMFGRSRLRDSMGRRV